VAVFLELDDADARCLWVADDLIYVGTSHRDREHQLVILDKRGATVKTWRTPYLVSDIAIVGDTCYAALGPGELVTWRQRGLGEEPTTRTVDANAPKFAVHGNELWWGTSWGEIHTLDRFVTKVAKSLTGICVDAERIYAGYADGKLRVFSRAGKRLKLLAIGRRGTRCAIGDGVLVTLDQTTGETTVWDVPAFAERARFVHDPRRVPYGVIGVAMFAPYIITYTYEDLALHDRAGQLLASWHAPNERIWDVWVADDALLVADGAQVHKLALSELV
jgi:hypothetical protein